ncbi:hypothetical protein BpHYR1_003549 [Brachionus plicatilis]|uniref:Uncharacterized protein n=1 Tax=Brachionus plicatilis TaxID=10195 RepID=A0A3M7QEL7_BRAPC|nr:hypothetical protein BpHYR1_003549 [Brachionus plicatilis]
MPAGGTTPLPACIALPRPGRPAAPGKPGILAIVTSSFGGGPSTVIVTKCSPRSKTRPSVRFSSFSSLPPFGLTFLNSSQSPSIMFMCLSNALKVPTNCRLS